MRSDLANLTPEALAKEANMGFVKRAQKEIAEGIGPEVQELSDGTVVANFAADNVTTKLPPGKALKDTLCSCGAKGVCRHRVAAVLVYAAGAGVETRPPWTITVDELVEWLGPRIKLVDQAESEGLDVEVSIRPPKVRFSGCTVSFLAGAQLDRIDCDCKIRKCVHVPLAIRAFQRLSPADRERVSVKLRMGPPPRQIASIVALESSATYLRRFMEKGLGDARGLDQARAEARAAVVDCPWLDGVIEDLEIQRSAWEGRSAVHDPGRVRMLLMEAFARIRSASRGHDPAALLGMGEPIEVPIERARLLSLGARISAIGSTRSLEVLFWDGATVVSWFMPLPANAEVANVMAVANTPLSVLAAGQVVSEHLVRLARRTIEIRRGQKTQVMPQKGQWIDIPAPYGFSSPTALLRNEADRPPWFLRHRARTEALRVVATPRGVTNLSFSPGRQTLTGLVEDDEGGSLLIERTYEWFAPGAIAKLAEELPNACFVSGWLRGAGARKALEPIAIVTKGDEGRVIVPDLAPDMPIPPLPMTGADIGHPLDTVLLRLEAALETLAQEGVLGGRIPSLVPVLQGTGLRRLADMYSRLEMARAANDGPAATKAWADAAIAVGLARA
jgi:hypothetical protein